MEYIIHIAILLNIYIILALSANITVGLANRLTLCQAAFYGIGAYIGTYFLLHCNLPIFIVVLTTMIITGIFSLFVSLAAIKLKGDYFVLATIGFQMIVYTILLNWTDVTNGPYGVPGIPGLKFLGFIELSGPYTNLVISAVFMLLSLAVFKALRKSPYGRVLMAMRLNEVHVTTTGRNTTLFKSTAFFISAALASIAGILYSSYTSYIDPTIFTMDESIFILSALFIGGCGNTKGSVVGAVFVIIIPEMLRFMGLPDTIAANARHIIYGLTLVLFMYLRPQGICGEISAK